jgi:hypothetical protein
MQEVVSGARVEDEVFHLLRNFTPIMPFNLTCLECLANFQRFRRLPGNAVTGSHFMAITFIPWTAPGSEFLPPYSVPFAGQGTGCCLALRP